MGFGSVPSVMKRRERGGYIMKKKGIIISYNSANMPRKLKRKIKRIIRAQRKENNRSG